MMKKLLLVPFALLLAVTSSAFAQLDTPWVASGTGTVSLDDDGTSGVAQMSYFSPTFNGNWGFSTTAATARTIKLKYKYSGFHAYFNVRVGLTAVAGATSFPLVNAGPVNCCTPPSGGFNYEGEIELTVAAGEAYGFLMSGSHFDSDTRLIGTLTVEAVIIDSDGDGVLDNADQCPATPAGAVVNANGCTGIDIVEALCPVTGTYKNHGAFVSCVSKAVEAVVADGLLTAAEGEAVVSAAAKSNVGKPPAAGKKK